MKTKIDLDGPKIILHNITTRAVDKNVSLFNFDQRGLVYASAGDTVITRNPVDADYLDYLTGLGWPIDEVTHIHAAGDGNSGYKYIFTRPEIIAAVNRSSGYLDTYHLTTEERHFALVTGKPLYGRPEIAQRFGTKSGFASLCLQLGIPVPAGYSGLQEPDQVVRSLDALFKEGARACVVKEDEGTASYGSTVIEHGEFDRMGQQERLETVAAALHRIEQINVRSSARVEVWVDGVISSPSAQLQVLPNGEIRFNSTHDQMLYGREQEYIGASYPCRSAEGGIMDKFLTDAQAIAVALAERGYTGHMGLDAVLTRDGELFWVDANLRKPGTFYPRIVTERLRGSLEKVCYYARNFHLGRDCGYSFADMYEALGEFRYDKLKGSGAVIYNMGALAQEGRLDIVSIGGCPEDARYVYGGVCSAIEPMAVRCQ
ncbi:MAG: hypothetical protein PHT33_11115 [bacterium]|nr:hypothetical protein [bacterium]